MSAVGRSGKTFFVLVCFMHWIFAISWELVKRILVFSLFFSPAGTSGGLQLSKKTGQLFLTFQDPFMLTIPRDLPKWFSSIKLLERISNEIRIFFYAKITMVTSTSSRIAILHQLSLAFLFPNDSRRWKMYARVALAFFPFHSVIVDLEADSYNVRVSSCNSFWGFAYSFTRAR